MTGRHVDRIWMIAGAAVVVVLTVVTWFLLVSPKYAEADTLRVQAEDTATQLARLRADVAKLREESTKLGAYQEALRSRQQALPAGNGTDASAQSDFLRQLASASTLTGVETGGLTVATPVDGPVPGVQEVSITLTAEGRPANLSRFLHQLQAAQPRAVLVQAATLGAGGGSTGGSSTVTLTLTVFQTKSTPGTAATPAATATAVAGD